MMRFLLTAAMVFFVLGPGTAQEKWNKHTVATIEDDCFVFLTNYHRTLLEQQKNAVAECAAKSVKARFASPGAFRATSNDARFEFIESVTRKCAKDILGLDLEVAKQSAELKADSAQMVGHWYDGKIDFYLSPDGKVAISYDPDRDPDHGTWTLKNNVLVLKTYRAVHGNKVTVMRLEAFQGDFFLYRSEDFGLLHTVEKR